VLEPSKVRVEIQSTTLGYVPKTHSMIISKMIANGLFKGTFLTAKIIKLSPELEPWNALKIEVKEVKADWSGEWAGSIDV